MPYLYKGQAQVEKTINHIHNTTMTYGYIRVSSDKQTVENQRFEINNICEQPQIALNDCPDYMLCVAVLVSTDKIDRIDMEISYKNQSIDEIERMAASFYVWCGNNFNK